MLSEQGVIGIGLLIIILYGALRSGFELNQIGRSEFHKGLGFGFLGCVIACIVNNIFGDRWSYPTLGGIPLVGVGNGGQKYLAFRKSR